MHRILLLALMAACCSSLKAQSVYTASYEGRTVFVFPYRLEGNWKNNTPEHRYFGSSSALVDIPFSPVTLPDGEYIAYCPMPTPRMDKKNMRQFYLKKDTTVVAARFRIVNNQKQGPAMFYDTRTLPDGRQLISYHGRYEKDRKEGVWTKISYNYYGIVVDSTHIPFRENLIDGEVVRYSGTGKRYATIPYKTGQKNGVSRVFDDKGTLTKYTTYRNDERHGWEWDTSRVENRKYPYSESNLRWFQNDVNTQEGRFIFQSTHRSYVRTVKMLDSIDLSDRNGWERFQDSGIWYSENTEGMLALGSWPHQISPEYRNRDFVRNKRYESRVVYSDGNESTVYFLGKARRVTAYEIDFKYRSGKTESQVHQTLQHIGYDSMFGNLFLLKRWEDGSLEKEVHYALKNFRATVIREVTIEKTRDGNPRCEVETRPQYYTAVLRQPLPFFFTLDSIQTYDKKGDLYYRSVRRAFISADTVYLLIERVDMDKDRNSRLRPMRMEIVRHTDSTYTLRQYAGFPELPELTELSTVHTKPKSDQTNLFSLEDFKLSNQTFLSSLEYGFPDRTSTQLLLNGKPFTGGWNIHLDKHRLGYDRGGEEVEDLKDFKLVQIKRRFLPGYDTFIHVSATGLPAWINPRSMEDSDYPDRKKIKHIQADIYTQWMNGILSGGANAWDNESSRRVKAEYAMGRKHGVETFSWENEHGQTSVFHNHYENGERVGNYTPPMNPGIHQIRPYRRNKPDGLHVIPGNNEKQVSFFMSQGIPDLHIIQSEINTGWISDSLSVSKGIPNGYYRSYYTKLESNSGPDFDRMSEEEIMEYASRNPVETAMPSTARMPRSEVFFNQGFAEGKARFWFEKGGVKAEVTFRQQDSMQLFKVDQSKDGFTLRALKAVEPRSSSKYDRRLESYAISPSEYETGGRRDVTRRSSPWSLTSRLPIVLEYRNAVDYDEDGLTARGREWLELSNSWTADYRYFFLNGQVSQEGRVENGQRTGWWIFNTESGSKLKEIEYTPGSIPAPNGSGDTLHYKGRIKGYHPKGYLLYEGYVLDASFSYSCATETDLSFEDIWYTAFYDSLGNQTLQNHSGKVYDYHVNTVKRMEGFIRNGLYDSTWYQYSNGGTLESAGKYRNGKKNGRWLLGDLEGINFLDNQCFDAGDEWRMMQMANELDFTEEIWSDGKLVRTSTLNIKRDGSADDYSPASFEKKPWRWGKKRIRSIQERVLYRDHEDDDDEEFEHHRRRGFIGTPEF